MGRSLCSVKIEVDIRPKFFGSPQNCPIFNMPDRGLACYVGHVRERILKFVTIGVWAAVAGCVFGALGGWLAAQFLHLPLVDTIENYRPAATTHIYDSENRLVASYAVERRVVLPPEQIPDHLKLAIVAAEDSKFYEHGGVDPKAVLRAALGSISSGKFGGRGGGSTITQQLALNLFLKRERTLTRKAKEAMLAIDIEKRYSKDQIITLYANQIFFGHGAYGVEAASLLYFDIPAMDLTVPQAAMLAAIIPSANNKFDPIRKPESALARRNWVLQRMLSFGFIDIATCKAAINEPLGAELHREVIDTGAYFLEMVRQEIEEIHGTDALYKDGREVHLTMNSTLQIAAERAVRDGLVALDMRLGYRQPVNVKDEGDLEGYAHPSWRHLEFVPANMARGLVTGVDRKKAQVRIADRAALIGLESAKWTGTTSMSRILSVGDIVMVRLPESIPDDPTEILDVGLLQEPEIEAALLAMDNRSGAVLAMVGGFDFGRSEFNRAVQSKLQCGSAFKPFVYLTAFQQGFTPADTLFDAPLLLPDGEGELTYCPKNYYNKYYGIATLRRALELSFNSAAVKLQAMVGGEAVVETAKNFGISTELRPYSSLALGTLGVRLIDLVRAYAGFANLGEVPEPYMISEVYDRNGRLEERFFPRTQRVASAPVTYLLLHVLEGVVTRGTGQSARRLGAHLAGKTGTTDEYSDAWFVGFSPRITVGVWVGRNVKAPIGKQISGAVGALPIWNRFMESYLETLSEEEKEEGFPVPAGVVFSPVDAFTGLSATPNCTDESRVVLEAFLDGTEPAESCKSELHDLHEMPWPFQQPFYSARPTEPMPTAESVAAADERLKPTPTAGELAAQELAQEENL